MASTNKTSNFNLSQYVGTDKPTYLSDYNTDMLNIDAGMQGNKVAIGNLNDLQTTIKTDIVSALNEVKSENQGDTQAITDLQTNQGQLSSLTTSEKSNLVGAINEVDANAKSNSSQITTVAGNVDGLTTDFNNSKAVTLFNNAGGSSSNITLSDSSANYQYLEIFYKDNDGHFSSVKVNEPDGKQFFMIAGTYYNNAMYFLIKNASISGNAITNAGTGKLVAGSTNTVTTDNNIYITKVIGFKN